MALPAAIGSLLGEGVFGKLAAASFNVQALVGGIKSLGSVITNVLTTAVTGPVVPAIKAMAGAIQLVQAPVLHVVDAIRLFRDSVGALGASVSEFVRLASPVHVTLFNLALDDLTASFGKILMPILEASTDMVRAFGDAVFTLAGPMQVLIAGALKPLGAAFQTMAEFMVPLGKVAGSFVSLLGDMAGVIQPLLGVFKPVADVFATLIQTAVALVRPFFAFEAVLFKLLAFPFEILFTGMAKALELLAGPLIAIGNLLGDFADAVGMLVEDVLKSVRDLFGIGETTIKKGASVGAAVRPATIGSVEDYGKKAQQAAFSLGTAATPADRTANYVELIYKYIKSEMWSELAKLLPGSKTLTDAATAARDAGRHVEEGTASTGERIFDAATLGGLRRGLGI